MCGDNDETAGALYFLLTWEGSNIQHCTWDPAMTVGII